MSLSYVLLIMRGCIAARLGPLRVLLNATDYILYACSRTDIRLYEERNRLPIRQRRTCSRCN